MDPQPLAEAAGLYELFRRDVATCRTGVDALVSMLHDFTHSKEKARRIHEIEREGDRLTVEMFALLARVPSTPMERQDIIALTSGIDDVLDSVDEVATMLVLYGVTQPTVYLLEASALLVQAMEAVAGAIDRMESLSGLEPYTAEVHRLEEEADGLYHNAIAELFLPDTYPPIEIMKWNRLYDLMEQAFDTCEDLSKTLQNVLLKHH